MSRLLVIVSRGARLEGVVADAAQDADGVRVFTLAGTEVARVRAHERYVVRAVPGRCFPRAACGPTVAAAR